MNSSTMSRSLARAYYRERIARMLFGRSRRARPIQPLREPLSKVAFAGAPRDSVAIVHVPAAAAAESRGMIRCVKDWIARVLRGNVSTGTVWLPSFVALGAADTVSASRTISRSFHGLELLGAAGGVGLIAASSRDFQRAETTEQRLDAASDFAWGAQGILYMTTSRPAAKVAVGLGLFGALIQAAVGALRIERGIVRRDAEMIKLGALDVGGGCLWFGWDVVGLSQPLFVASYVVLMVGREAYANRTALAKLGQGLAARLGPPALA